jgi:hypothetical protein
MYASRPLRPTDILLFLLLLSPLSSYFLPKMQEKQQKSIERFGFTEQRGAESARIIHLQMQCALYLYVLLVRFLG